MGKFSLAGRNIIITSNEPWGDVWFSKQNYAYELSRHNKVVFLNPQGKWSLKNLLGCKIRARKYSENLTILDYNNILPIRSKLLYSLNNNLVSSALAKYFKIQSISNILLWAFDPNRLSSPNKMGIAESIYHVVDPYNFEQYGEVPLCENVDVIFCNTPAIAPEYTQFKKPLYIVPHGISEDEFSVNKMVMDVPEIDLAEYGLYIGSIDERINFSLLEDMLEKFPDIPFLFIGPFIFKDLSLRSSNIFTQKKYGNLHYYPPIHFKKLKYFIAKAKFCLSINNIRQHENVVSHHKLLQYLALGKPVFGSDIIEPEKLNKLLYMSDGGVETIRQLEVFIRDGEPQEIALERIQYAKTFTFGEIFKKVEEFMNKKD